MAWEDRQSRFPHGSNSCRLEVDKNHQTATDPEAVTYVKFWPSWNIGFGQIGAKASSLVGKFPTVPLPPDLPPGIRAEEKKLAKEERTKKKEDEARLRGEEGRGEKRQAGADEESSKGDDPDMSDYTPTQPDEEKDERGLVITDDTLLQDLLDSLEEPMVESEVDKAPVQEEAPWIVQRGQVEKEMWRMKCQSGKVCAEEDVEDQIKFREG